VGMLILLTVKPEIANRRPANGDLV
jgi:hypothetical protein